MKTIILVVASFFSFSIGFSQTTLMEILNEDQGNELISQKVVKHCYWIRESELEKHRDELINHLKGKITEQVQFSKFNSSDFDLRWSIISHSSLRHWVVYLYVYTEQGNVNVFTIGEVISWPVGGDSGGKIIKTSEITEDGKIRVLREEKHFNELDGTVLFYQQDSTEIQL